MATRNLLHKSKLEEFARWCLMTKGYMTLPGRGEFQVLQVEMPGHGFVAIYEKIRSKEHYSVDKRMVNLVMEFIEETKRRKV